MAISSKRKNKENYYSLLDKPNVTKEKMLKSLRSFGVHIDNKQITKKHIVYLAKALTSGDIGEKITEKQIMEAKKHLEKN